MIKNKNSELLENSGVRLTITVEKDFIRKEYDELVAEHGRTVRLDGFRKGKVPAGILIRKFGDVLVGETAERVIRKSLEKVLEESEQKPIATSIPQVDSEETLELGKDFTYKVIFDTYPQIELPEYKGLEYEELSVQISDKDIDRELKALQEQNSVVVDKKEGVVLKGDIVNVDFVELDPEGKELAASKRQSFVFEVGSGYNLYKIDEDLVGMEKEREKIITRDYPQDFEFKELAGRRVILKVKLNSIKEKQLPEVNDELAQDISDKYKSLEDLKKDIQEKLEKYQAQKVREHSISQLLEKIAVGAKIPLPISMVENELQDEWLALLSRYRAEEKLILRELEKEGKTKESVLGDWRPAAEKKLKLRLAVGEMVKRENIQVSEEEMNSRVQQDAEARSISFEQAKQLMSKNNLLDLVKFDIKNEKLYDLLLASGVKKEGKEVKFLDLAQGNY